MLLVDEASMLDILLMNQLLGALPASAALVLVGDQDQLPPVGPGRVLADLLSSRVIPSKKLTKIYRQTQLSSIIKAAHMVNNGESPTDLERNEDSDFYFVPEENSEKILAKIIALVSERIPKKLQIDPKNDIMVLSPTKKGELGTVNINTQLGKVLNTSGGPSVSRFGQVFRINDRVMQVRNNYAKEVYNGDLGKVISLNMEDQELRVAFDERRISYDFAELDELAVAWATTVHKAQGTEFPAVVIPIHPSHNIMLRRKLIYTAITRGRRMVFLVGSPAALRRACQNNTEDYRYSHLDQLLIGSLK
jgi:exodeoxyribonuclease V alpha subunit